jgi:hypothetical protein
MQRRDGATENTVHSTLLFLRERICVPQLRVVHQESAALVTAFHVVSSPLNVFTESLASSGHLL